MHFLPEAEMFRDLDLDSYFQIHLFILQINRLKMFMVDCPMFV